MFKVKEAAKRLEVSVDTIYSLLGSGKLQCHRIGKRTIRISEDQVMAFLADTATRAKATPAPSHRPALVKSRYFRRP